MDVPKAPRESRRKDFEIHAPTTTNETAEQWAERVFESVLDAATTGDGVRAQLAATYRDAQAMKLWREEALAVDMARNDAGTWQAYYEAQQARINAGLA